MLSKAQNKYIRSLSQQKYRKEHNVFIAEGDKIAREWLASAAKIQIIVSLQDWADDNAALIAGHSEAVVHIVDQHELESVSTLQAAHKVLLVVDIEPASIALPTGEWCLALNNIQDPGNMGTIIRTADWFGINHIICSPDCVDVYNPKVVQAAMGGHLRVQLHTANLKDFIELSDMPVYAAALNGQSVYEVPKQDKGILIIGNESKGVSPELMELATQRITIPRIGGAESLNAAVSAAILCALLIGR